jgi:hypothetical protein
VLESHLGRCNVEGSAVDPDPAFHFIVDSNPTFPFDADPDPTNEVNKSRVKYCVLYSKKVKDAVVHRRKESPLQKSLSVMFHTFP